MHVGRWEVVATYEQQEVEKKVSVVASEHLVEEGERELDLKMLCWLSTG